MLARGIEAALVQRPHVARAAIAILLLLALVMVQKIIMSCFIASAVTAQC